MPRARVLVLEHHRDLREALVDALLDESYVVTPARSVEAALEAIRTAGDAQLPDVLVVDAQDGHDLVAAVRADPRCQVMTVVSLSFAFDPPCGADVEVRRPFRLDEFLDAVRYAVARHDGEGATQHP